MKTVVLVALGGAAGSLLRFAIQRLFNHSFPYGTLAVNLVGCFLIGILWAVLVEKNAGKDMQFLLITGFCGGFTTFSAFSQESMHLFFSARYLSMAAYLVCSVAGGLLATAAGYKLFS
jgi:fluoride exporter